MLPNRSLQTIHLNDGSTERGALGVAFLEGKSDVSSFFNRRLLVDTLTSPATTFDSTFALSLYFKSNCNQSILCTNSYNKSKTDSQKKNRELEAEEMNLSEHLIPCQ